MKTTAISLIILALIFPSSAVAVDGFVSFGTFFDQQNVYSRPDGGLAEYTAQVEIGHRMGFLTGTLRPYLNWATLMDDYHGNGTFQPASINYTVGLDWEKALGARAAFFAHFKHFCWHPVDSGGAVAQANYIEVGFRFPGGR